MNVARRNVRGPAGTLVVVAGGGGAGAGGEVSAALVDGAGDDDDGDESPQPLAAARATTTKAIMNPERIFEPPYRPDVLPSVERPRNHHGAHQSVERCHQNLSSSLTLFWSHRSLVHRDQSLQLRESVEVSYAGRPRPVNGTSRGDGCLQDPGCSSPGASAIKCCYAAFEYRC